MRGLCMWALAVFVYPSPLRTRVWTWLCKPAFSYMYPWQGEFDLCIEGTGNCAMTSFRAYVEKWNPGIRICSHSHTPAAVWYCARKNIPIVLMWRAQAKVVDTMVNTHGHPRIAARARYTRMMGCIVEALCRVSPGRSRPVMYPYTWLNSPKGNPAQTVASLNQQFGLQLNEGDGVLPRLHVSDLTAEEKE